MAAWLVGFGLLLGCGAAVSSAEDLAALDALTGRWMALRAALADEQRTWEQQQEHWQQEIALLRAEKQRRTAEIAASREVMSDLEGKRADVLRRKERMERAFAQLEPVVSAAEEDLRDWEQRIPAGLRRELAQGFAGLRQGADGSRRPDVVRRLQNAIGLYTDIESLQNRIHVTREVLDVGDVRREVSVLYLGLSRAFGVSTGGDWAGIGEPQAEGWKWKAAPDLAPQIQLALAVANREEVAQLVELPMQIQAPREEQR